jgi:hypothetical protein
VLPTRCCPAFYQKGSPTDDKVPHCSLVRLGKICRKLSFVRASFASCTLVHDSAASCSNGRRAPRYTKSRPYFLHECLPETPLLAERVTRPAPGLSANWRYRTHGLLLQDAARSPGWTCLGRRGKLKASADTLQIWCFADQFMRALGQTILDMTGA